MPLLRPLRWREGMFLRPHHLQQQDLYLESRAVGYLHATETYGWGLIRLDIDVDALDNHVMAVRSLRAILPDGALVDVPGNARLPNRQIDRKGTEAGRPFDVFLGLRALEERHPLARPQTDSSAPTRFVNVSEEAYDLDAGRDPIPVERLEYDLTYFMGEEPTQGHQILPLARLTFTGDPAHPIRLAPGWSPPCVMLAASPVLTGMARGVVENLANVLTRIAQFRGGDRFGELILYQALAGSLPVLKDMVLDGMVHPRRVYHELARLAGSLYYRDKSNRSFDEIPAYDHDDPAPVFDRLRRLVEDLSGEVGRLPYLRIPLERSGDQYRGSLPSEARAGGARLFLEVVADESAPSVRTILQAAKISGPARIETLSRFALPGIAREAQPSPPPELGPGQKGAFFRLKVEEGTEWQTHVIPAGELSAFLLGAPKDVKLNLIVVMAGG